MSQNSFSQQTQNLKKLGISNNATKKEIKNAYRILALKYHPDKPDGDLNEFMEITAAYKNLMRESDISPDMHEKEKDEDIFETLIKLDKERMKRLVKLNKERKEERREEIKSNVLFITFFLIGIPSLIFMWNLHPIVGLLALAIFLWMINNKWKTGYYFG